MTRLRQVLQLIEDALAAFTPLIRVIEHYVDEESQAEYINVRASMPSRNAVLVIRQYWRGGVLAAYGYYVRVKDYEEWWDNRPHHPEVPTQPHHRHVGGRVEPLPDPSLEKFIARVRELLQNADKG